MYCRVLDVNQSGSKLFCNVSNMASIQYDVITELEPKGKKEGKLVNENQNSCQIMETNIQALINELKTVNEIINILSEEWRHCKVIDEVRVEEEQNADKVEANNLISCNCDIIKTQCLELRR